LRGEIAQRRRSRFHQRTNLGLFLAGDEARRTRFADAAEIVGALTAAPAAMVAGGRAPMLEVHHDEASHAHGKVAHRHQIAARAGEG
jgi:hypothetical protein